MRVLLDTHAVIWWVDQDGQLGDVARETIAEPSNDLLVSAATIWEISIKCGLGKLTLSLPLRDWMSQAIVDLRASILPVTIEYAATQSELPAHHSDPFDRLLIAQAKVESIPIISRDGSFDDYNIDRLW